MTTVVATHAVGDMDTWLAGGDERTALFANFCTGHRILGMPMRIGCLLFLKAPI
jgi:hypothetical protein